ncbi:MAG: hypothetical protein AABX51_05035, partial [Nanoarchaeota archaeon]
MKRKSCLLSRKIFDEIRNIPPGARNTFVLIALFMITAILLFFTYGNSFFIIALLFILGAGSLSYKRWYKGIPLGIEQVTMTTFVVSKAFGLLPGLIFGVITAITGQYILGNDFDADAIPFFLGVAFVGFLAYSMPFPDIVSVALCSVIV